jgi:hypothetical protein
VRSISPAAVSRHQLARRARSCSTQSTDARALAEVCSASDCWSDKVGEDQHALGSEGKVPPGSAMAWGAAMSYGRLRRGAAIIHEAPRSANAARAPPVVQQPFG